MHPYGPDLGVQTIGEKVRCPDALITCTKFPDTEQLAPDVVIVFEVISGDSGRRDRIETVREYATVPSIRRYVIVESANKDLLVLHRRQGGDAFTALALTEDDILELPEAGIAVPVAELYQDVAFAEAGATE